ncbi:hypothetical protein KEJ36_02560 [Candidatus Bathyarchaeota archaeon]|nr:hypothetical protein [Candidatus Bathyarchaeota archaeon]MBS7627692.1 hypothetical protein [Candidatus Bathyarchaeota archaeon]
MGWEASIGSPYRRVAVRRRHHRKKAIVPSQGYAICLRSCGICLRGMSLTEDPIESKAYGSKA